MKKAPTGRIIRRKNAAGIFYSDSKIKRFYKGRVPNSVTLAEVHSRMELYNQDGSRRKTQGVAIIKRRRKKRKN